MMPRRPLRKEYGFWNLYLRAITIVLIFGVFTGIGGWLIHSARTADAPTVDTYVTEVNRELKSSGFTVREDDPRVDYWANLLCESIDMEGETSLSNYFRVSRPESGMTPEQYHTFLIITVKWYCPEHLDIVKQFNPS